MHDNIVIQQRVDATAERVWKALTDKALIKEWYFDIPDFSLEPHSEFSFYESSEGQKYQHHGEILEVIPQKKLKHSWSYPEISKDKTILKWELAEEGEATLVTLTHKGLENLEHLGQEFSHENFEKGWLKIIDALKAFAEK